MSTNNVALLPTVQTPYVLHAASTKPSSPLAANLAGDDGQKASFKGRTYCLIDQAIAVPSSFADRCSSQIKAFALRHFATIAAFASLGAFTVSIAGIITMASPSLILTAGVLSVAAAVSSLFAPEDPIVPPTKEEIVEMRQGLKKALGNEQSLRAWFNNLSSRNLTVDSVLTDAEAKLLYEENFEGKRLGAILNAVPFHFLRDIVPEQALKEKAQADAKEIKEIYGRMETLLQEKGAVFNGYTPGRFALLEADKIIDKDDANSIRAHFRKISGEISNLFNLVKTRVLYDYQPIFLPYPSYGYGYYW